MNTHLKRVQLLTMLYQHQILSCNISHLEVYADCTLAVGPLRPRSATLVMSSQSTTAQMHR